MSYNEHLELVHGGAKASALGSSKAHAQIFKGHNGVWIEVSWRCLHVAIGLLRLGLGREHKRLEEHLGLSLASAWDQQ